MENLYDYILKYEAIIKDELKANILLFRAYLKQKLKEKNDRCFIFFRYKYCNNAIFEFEFRDIEIMFKNGQCISSMIINDKICGERKIFSQKTKDEDLLFVEEAFVYFWSLVQLRCPFRSPPIRIIY